MSEVGPDQSPLVLRGWLAERLRHYRDLAGLSQSEAARRLDWSVSKLQRIETEVVGVSVTDTSALLNAYGLIDEQVVHRLQDVARAARRRDKFSQYRKFFSSEYNVLVSYEESATAIRSVNSFVLPGLLQTPAYARALLAVRHAGGKLEALVEARAVRQEILVAANPPYFQFLIDEAMLYRRIGGLTVLLDQLDQLGRIGRMENVELRVIPFEADVHLGLWEQFVIMTIPPSELISEASEVIIYREAGDSEHLIRHDHERVRWYVDAFDEVLSQTLSQADSQRMIERRRRDLETSPSAEPSMEPR